jgi:plasmid stability protein
MAQLIVRNLEDDVRDKLRDLARHHGRSMEEEVRDILRGAVMGKGAARPALGSRLAERFSGHGLDEDVRELRGQPIEPPSFDG